MTDAESYRPQDVENYPIHMVVGIVAPDAVAQVIADLEAAGIASEQIDSATGAADAQRIVEGNERGWLGRLAERIAAGDEHRQRQEYVTALQQGAAVIRVRLQDENQKSTVATLLAHHNGHYINYYGRWTVESLRP